MGELCVVPDRMELLLFRHRALRLHRRPANPRRSLFGRPDHSENQAFVRRELEEIRAKDMQRWNFDFAREVPLPGKFAWHRVGGTTSVDEQMDVTSEDVSATRPSQLTCLSPSSRPTSNPLSCITNIASNTTPQPSSKKLPTSPSTSPSEGGSHLQKPKSLKRLSATQPLKQTLCTDFFKTSSRRASAARKAQALTKDTPAARLNL